MVVNGWLKGVSGIILLASEKCPKTFVFVVLASEKCPKTFVFVVFRVVFGTKKAAFGRPGVQLVTFGYNSTHIQL